MTTQLQNYVNQSIMGLNVKHSRETLGLNNAKLSAQDK